MVVGRKQQRAVLINSLYLWFLCFVTTSQETGEVSYTMHHVLSGTHHKQQQKEGIM